MDSLTIVLDYCVRYLVIIVIWSIFSEVQFRCSVRLVLIGTKNHRNVPIGSPICRYANGPAVHSKSIDSNRLYIYSIKIGTSSP